VLVRLVRGQRADPLTGIQLAHGELHIRHVGDTGLMDSPVVTMMHRVLG
jgi:integrase/recombinase XerD